MKHILVLHDHGHQRVETVQFLGQSFTLEHKSCFGDVDKARSILAVYADKVDAVALEDMPAELALGSVRRTHPVGQQLMQVATMPVVDGRVVRAGLERWAVILADRAQPGIFSRKRVLMTPGLNHNGLAQALEKRGCDLRYADPFIYFRLPAVPGIGSRRTRNPAAARTLDQLKGMDYGRLYPEPNNHASASNHAPFHWADIIAGDISVIRHFAPAQLKHKTVAVEWATADDLADLRQRGVSIVAVLLPALAGADGRVHPSAATLEAILTTLLPDPAATLDEDAFLDLMADLQWSPTIHYLQPEEAGVNRFAFVIHPLHVGFVHHHRLFRWTRYLPDGLVEAVAAYLPPLYLSRITGGQSPTTGQRIEGILISLGATPRQMMRHGERFTYDRLHKAAMMAERKGARIMGLGAFTSVVGDAGITVAHEADIAITSGNSLTVSATLEAAKQAVIKMGVTDLTTGKVMVIGATGSIGSVCSRLLAQAINDVVLVSIEPERLIDLKRTIQAETPGAQVTIATHPHDTIGACDLIVTATSAFGQRIVDISKCKPGAVVCDVARPPDISRQEAALRPDVLVIESGEVLIPGDINFGYDIGLPPKTAYACLAETALLAMDGRFEDYTLGRSISMAQVKEIYRLFNKHQFQIAGLRSFGDYVSEEMVAQKRQLAETLRRDPAQFMLVQQESSAKLAKIPVQAKGVRSSGSSSLKWAAALGVTAVLGLMTGWRLKGRP